MRSFTLENKIILITGAAGHLGKAICHQLAGASAHVLINGRSAEKLQVLAEAIKNGGGKATPLSGDITNEADQQNIVGCRSFETTSRITVRVQEAAA